MANTFTLNIGSKVFGDAIPPRLGAKVYPIADSVTKRKLKYLRDTTGNKIVTGHAEAKATPDQLTARLLPVPNLPDPRDTAYDPSGFGLLVELDAFYFRQTFIFGATEIAAYIIGGVVELEDVIAGEVASFTSVGIPLATAADLTAETARATAAEATKVNSSTYTAGLASKADASTTSKDLPDTTVGGASGQLAASVTSNVAANGAYTSPALDAAVAAPPERFSIKANAAGGCTLTLPDSAGTSQVITLLPGEARTYRQKTTLGWGLEDGIPLSQLDARYGALAGPNAWGGVQNFSGATVSGLGMLTTETNAPLGAGATFVGAPTDTQGVLASPAFSVAAAADQPFTLSIEQSADGITGWSQVQSTSSVLTGSMRTASLVNVATARYQRVKVVCGGTAMSSLSVTSQLGTPGALGPAGATGAAGVALPPDIQTLTANGTWTKPTSGTPTTVEVLLIAGGGGGGSGRRGAAGTVRCGAGGAGSGAVTQSTFRAADLPATVSVAVGAGGAGANATTADDTNGTNGSAGGASTFGGYARAAGGGSGGGGTATAGTAGTAGVGRFLGTAGAAASTTGLVGPNGTSGTSGAGGGGAGGGITAGDTVSNGGNGGATTYVDNVATTGGIAGGATPTTASDSLPGVVGTAGAGGASSKTSAAQTGSAGSKYGAPGGGGGASLNGFASGAGGAGAAGCAVIITYF